MNTFLYILHWIAIVAGIYIAGVLFNLIIFIPICYRYDKDLMEIYLNYLKKFDKYKKTEE